MQSTLKPMPAGNSRRRERTFEIVRVGLGAGQMAGATTAVLPLLLTGLSSATRIAFTIPTVLLCVSLLMRYLGC